VSTFAYYAGGVILGRASGLSTDVTYLFPFLSCLSGAFVSTMGVLRAKPQQFDWYTFFGDQAYRVAQAFVFLLVVWGSWSALSERVLMGIDLLPNLLGFGLGMLVPAIERVRPLVRRLYRLEFPGSRLTQQRAEAFVREAPPISSGPVTSASAIQPVEELPPLPEPLLRACDSGEAVLVAGPSFPRLRGRPSSVDALSKLITTAPERPESGVDSRAIQHVVEGLHRGQWDLATDLLRRAYGPDVAARVGDQYDGGRLSATYRLLGEMNFAGVINMSWDSSVLAAFAHRHPSVIDPDSDSIIAANRKQGFSFVRLRGEPSSRSLALSPSETRAALYENETFRKFVAGLAQSASLLFLGVQVSDVEEFFETVLPPRTRRPGEDAAARREHYAIVPKSDLWSLQHDQLRRRFNVELIGYDPRHEGALETLVQTLADRSRRSDAPSEPLAASRPPTLTRIKLENIGAFESLDVELTPAWNVILGNNGCGKSTVLRAVALGLSGDHPVAAASAQSLLRVGSPFGVIQLWVGKTLHRTELSRTDGAVRVTSTSLTPLQTGSWAVLGFPALRGVSVKAMPQGATLPPKSPTPSVSDLLPLLEGQADTRLDDLKQWIASAELHGAKVAGDPTQMLRTFFAVLADLTPGLRISFDSVDPWSGQVFVKTDDGVVRLDHLSQGMNSILAWVGTLLQRMYDIYGDSENPAHQGAFVLIDEVDAHLHPSWQRMLPSLVRRHFPNVQCLATSHSPLLAAGLEADELLVARREPRVTDGVQRTVAEIQRTNVDTEGMRADQVLTSPLFGLATTRSPEEFDQIREYSRLLGLRARSSQQEQEFQRLQQKIGQWMFDGESAALRDSEQVRSRILNEPADTIGPLTRSEARVQLAEINDLMPSNERLGER
jgi:hypothetical protein